MKLVEYIERPNSDDELVDNDNVSMASSSIYTSPEKSIMLKNIIDGYERKDDKSMDATSFSMNGVAVNGCRVFPISHSTAGSDEVSSQSSDFIESEAYDVQDIERQRHQVHISNIYKRTVW